MLKVSRILTTLRRRRKREELCPSLAGQLPFLDAGIDLNADFVGVPW